MRFKQHINELAVKKKTHISKPQYREYSIYNQTITLEDGLKFLFTGYYFKSSDIWEMQFQDEAERTDVATKREGAAIELFAALEKVLIQFIETALPDKFEFRADLDEPKRVKLYDLIAKKIKKKFGFKYNRKVTSISAIYQFMHKTVKSWI